jgi:SAM-dependent methyltransferase
MNKLDRAIRDWLKRFPVAVAAKRKIDSIRYGFDYRICNSLPLFTPFSSGSYKDRAELTLQAANQSFPFLAHLLRKLKQNHLKVINAMDFPKDSEDLSAAFKIKAHLDEYGSNKANRHNYHYIYGPILKNTAQVTGVLEIGLGTNNTDVVSNMGTEGRPGASIRAFRDFLPNAQIYGADIDKRILFEETRIKTYFVDQTNLQSLDDLGNRIDEELDLIIDDGLHSPHANVAVVSFALDKVKSGGWLIIEDIAESALPFWEVVASLLPEYYQSTLIRAEGGLVFASQNKRKALA